MERYLGIGHAQGRLTVDLDDDVARADTGLFCRGILDRRDDDRFPIAVFDADPQADELSLECGAKHLRFSWIEEARMPGISETVDHPAGGAIEERLIVDLFGIDEL